MYGWVITKTDSDNTEVIGVSGGKVTKDFIMSSPLRQEFIMLCQGVEGFVRGFAVLDDNCDGFEPLDNYGSPNFGFTSIFYKEVDGKFHEL